MFKLIDYFHIVNLVLNVITALLNISDDILEALDQDLVILLL